jgi:hypothetical protein
LQFDAFQQSASLEQYCCFVLLANGSLRPFFSAHTASSTLLPSGFILPVSLQFFCFPLIHLFFHPWFFFGSSASLPGLSFGL